MPVDSADDQPALAGLSLPAAAPRSAPEAPVAELAQEHPVAEVLVDAHLAHLDRPFEYAVPRDLADLAQPGVRVRVRFAGRVVDGYLLARKAEAEHPGRLAPLVKVVSDEVVLTPHLAALFRQVADHYAGTMADVLRLAIPPRHARAEKALAAAELPGSTSSTHGEADGEVSVGGRPDGGVSVGAEEAALGWEPYPAGPALLRRLGAGQAPAAAWTAVPDAGSPHGWPAALASAVRSVHGGGRGAIVVVPDHRDVDRVAAALDLSIGPAAYVRLTADLGPEQRYTAWLRVLRGHVRVVVGTRSAAFAPVADLGLVAWWDDGDDNLQEPRAPYPHVREVLRLRARLAGAGLLVGGFARTVEVQAWVAAGVLREVVGSASAMAESVPRVTIAGEGHQGARDAGAASARMPTVAWRAVKSGLESGPVLVQVPRRGYLLALSCQHCRTAVRCGVCSGPLQWRAAGGPAVCGWCSHPDDGRPCRECGGAQRRTSIVGEERTAEEVGRAFAGARVVVSRAGQVVPTVPDRPAVVVATPGAEPVAVGGYAATLLLDGWALVDRGGLDSGIEALRRWLAAAALTRAGAPVVLAGVPPHAGLPAVEALVRWAPAWLAGRELEERAALGLPPARRTATVSGDAAAVQAAAETLRSPAAQTRLEVLGPLPVGRPTPHATAGATGPEQVGQLRLVVREMAPSQGTEPENALTSSLRKLRAARSLRKEPGELIARLDPVDLDL